jgi:ribonuclease BN (tRNA processing enzyme)
MRFTVLGSGTTFADRERGPAGFLVESRGLRWLVDGGTGTLRQCATIGVDPSTLDGGFYSHRHPDHCADLVPLLFSMRVAGRKGDYPIWAGQGFLPFFEALGAAWGKWIAPGDGAVHVTELPIDGAATVQVGPLTVHTRPARHPAGALHLRFEADGSAVVFSGDTGASEDLVALATGADLLVCECAGSDEHRIDDHLWPSEIARIAAEARPAEIWLTHLYPGVDADQAIEKVAATGIPTRRARDLDVWVTGANNGVRQ